MTFTGRGAANEYARCISSAVGHALYVANALFAGGCNRIHYGLTGTGLGLGYHFDDDLLTVFVDWKGRPVLFVIERDGDDPQPTFVRVGAGGPWLTELEALHEEFEAIRAVRH